MDSIGSILTDPEEIRDFKTFILQKLGVCEKVKSKYTDYLEIVTILNQLYNLPDERPLGEARRLFLAIRGPLFRCERGIDSEICELRRLKEFISCVEKDQYMSPNLKVTRPLFERLCDLLLRPVNTRVHTLATNRLREQLKELKQVRRREQ